ncbi:hypothetical protein L484_004143 [Morus notabilis]|uniref:Uncharacterized protein n=1 Tax=Morus notabilis TaxID=981085 RepID=W9S5P3_9ROSA|nr:hypothetical protein L484_004143 [Morus notabilis]
MTQRHSSSTSSSSGSKFGMPTAGLAPDMQQSLSSLQPSHMELFREMMKLRPGVECTVFPPPSRIVLPRTDKEDNENEEER